MKATLTIAVLALCCAAAVAQQQPAGNLPEAPGASKTAPSAPPAQAPAAPAPTPTVPPAPTATPVVPAADQPSKQDVLKLFDLIHIKEQLESMQQDLAEQIAMSQLGDLDVQNLSPEQQGKLRDAMMATVQDVRNAYPTQEMEDDLVGVYQKHLTKADVQAGITFFSSPSGQKFIMQAPDMMNEAVQVSSPKIQQRLEALRPKIDARIKEALAEPAPAEKKPAPRTPAKKPAGTTTKKPASGTQGTTTTPPK